MKHIISIIISAILLVACSDDARWTPENLTDPYTVDKTYVLDPNNYFNEAQCMAINDVCDSLNTKADLETAIVILDRIDMEPFDFAVKLYNNWRLGRDSRGMILLIVIEQHKWQFVTGYGAEADFPDVILGRIGNNIMVPEFRNDRYANGVHKAMSEIFKVATDREYKAKEYGISQVNAVDNEMLEDEEDSEWTEGDWLECLFFLLVGGPFSCLYISYYGLRNVPLKNVEGKIRLYKNKECNVAYFSNNQRTAKWGLWANRKFIWYILFVGVFVWMVLEAFDYGDFIGCETRGEDFMHFWPYIAGFLGYSALVNAIVAMMGMSGAKNNMEKLTRADALSRSWKLKFYMITAPYIGIPFYFIFKAMVKRYKCQAIRCPSCNGKVHSSSKQYIPDTDARQYEVEHGIMEASMYTCDQGHETVLLMPTNKSLDYIFCTRCQAYSAKVTNKEEKVIAGFHYNGSLLYTATCECCGNITKEKIVVPKLSKLYDVSDSSSFYGSRSGGGSGSYSHGGGSRGGGYSGGGGAGGSW